MVKLGLLSPNLVKILSKLIQNQELCKLLYYQDKDVSSKPNLTSDQMKSLMFSKVFPYPFNLSTTTADTVEVRVYYLGVDFLDRIVEQGEISFDIVVSKNLWLVNRNGKSEIRPYEIMSQIVNDFHDISIDTIGKLKFTSFRHIPLDDKYDIIQLIADMELFTTGES